MRKPSFHYKSLLDTQLLMLLSIVLIITIILTMVFTDRVDNFKKEYRFKFFIYIFSMMFAFALVAFMGTTRAISDLLNEYIFYQCLVFILGTIHTILYRTYFDSFKKKQHPFFADELLFLLVMSLYAFIAFIITYTIFHSNIFSFITATCIFIFFIPALKHIGLRPSRKITLYNGALECKFHKFEMYRGSKKSKGTSANSAEE